MASEDISHGDIYHKMGVLEGKLDAVIVSVAEKKSDLGEAFRRIRVLEGRVAQGVILIAALAFLAPLAWSAIDPVLRIESTPKQDVNQEAHP